MHVLAQRVNIITARYPLTSLLPIMECVHVPKGKRQLN